MWGGYTTLPLPWKFTFRNMILLEIVLPWKLLFIWNKASSQLSLRPFFPPNKRDKEWVEWWQFDLWEVFLFQKSSAPKLWMCIAVVLLERGGLSRTGFQKDQFYFISVHGTRRSFYWKALYIHVITARKIQRKLSKVITLTTGMQPQGTAWNFCYNDHLRGYSYKNQYLPMNTSFSHTTILSFYNKGSRSCCW